jgi:hypothetical protein
LEGVFVRFYSASGRALTRAVAVTGPVRPVQYFSVAMDSQGKALVVWSPSGFALPLLGRFFNASGAPAGPEFEVSSASGLLRSPSAAAGPAGRFVVVWGQRMDDEETGTIVGRSLRWAGAGDAPCLARGGAFRCDVDRDGSSDAAFNFGGAAGPRLLGDLDGDGRDDACVFRDGDRGQSLLCDTAHDGGAAEVRLAFGLPGEEILLGDLDGEGRDDACVFRNDDRDGRFLCDTAHNGGTAELVFAFGGAGTPLLGDLNGDGAGDPCLAGGGELRCDTAHNGGGAEVEIPFDLEPGDVPLLGDVDGDGDDDPCVYRNGRFLCDTTHDGRQDTVLSLGGDPEGLPLLGNLQGT